MKMKKEEKQLQAERMKRYYDKIRREMKKKGSKPEETEDGKDQL